MVGGGTLHFVIPSTYEPLIPRALGAPRLWVLASGVAEIAAGVLLAVPRTARVGAWAVAAVLVGVLPGNVQMALDGGYSGASGLAASPVAAWARVPLQVPLVLWALAHARAAAPGGRRRERHSPRVRPGPG